MSFERSLVSDLEKRLAQSPDLLQVVVGPRQVGKTTAVLALLRRWGGPTRYAAADQFLPVGPEWIRTNWDLARVESGERPVLLALDEVQKVPLWSEAVKAEWDRDRREGRMLRVVLLGSSALMLARGTAESLAGRFFLHRCPHWSYPECRDAFGWDLDHWIHFGGFPGAAGLIADEEAWKSYMRDSLIEAALGRDVLALEPVTRPALLRQLFALACRYPAQVLSYNKMLGQLQDAGNATTLAHYLRLLDTAFLVTGLELHAEGEVRSRGASPKLVPRDNGLVAALDPAGFAAVRQDGAAWGRRVENAVGTHLLSRLPGPLHEVRYWRARDDEVDFVVRSGPRLVAFEVKSSRPGPRRGLEAFRARWPAARSLIVGPGGIELEAFLSGDPARYLQEAVPA